MSFDLERDLEKSRSAHTATNKALDETRERYLKVFDEKEILMVEEMKKEKRIEKPEAQTGSILDSYKTSKEFAENHALDFIEDFLLWRGAAEGVLSRLFCGLWEFSHSL